MVPWGVLCHVNVIADAAVGVVIGGKTVLLHQPGQSQRHRAVCVPGAQALRSGLAL